MRIKFFVKRLLETYDHAVLELPKCKNEKWKMYYLGRKSAVSDIIISVTRLSLLKLDENEEERGEL